MKVDEGAQDLEGGNLVTTVPTIGVDLEELKIKELKHCRLAMFAVRPLYLSLWCSCPKPNRLAS